MPTNIEWTDLTDNIIRAKVEGFNDEFNKKNKHCWRV